MSITRFIMFRTMQEKGGVLTNNSQFELRFSVLGFKEGAKPELVRKIPLKQWRVPTNSADICDTQSRNTSRTQR